ncbi:S49 family peptidase (plasmid) [Aliivibrio salmonicida]|uniref:S49 family peptidase n=1 Tax=Aliivibrio salmonicida TaxID=40269 RepID=UPI000F6F40E8|nr:S49 family peptidase [Aliivibrio salmonicida]AZL83490.1 S49 family peptidase [Aliivibrio salmonicida]
MTESFEQLNHNISELTKTVKKVSKHNWVKSLIPLTIMILFSGASWFLIFSDDNGPKKPHIAILSINGVMQAGSYSSDAYRLSTKLQELGKNKDVTAVLLKVNSGGGSPTEAEQISNAIDEFKATGKILITSIGATCASACYFAIANSDEIYNMQSSLVGSIGVRIDTWQYKKALDKIGIERRTLAAGENKTLLDPFFEVSLEDAAFIKAHLLDKLHSQFINTVVSGRGDKLSKNSSDLFSGLVWTGEESIDLGLSDKIGTPLQALNDLQALTNVTSTFDYSRNESRLGSILKGQLSSVFETQFTPLIN